MSISQPGRLLSGLLAGLESGLGLGLGGIYLGGLGPPKRIVLTTRAFPQTYFMHITVLVLLQASHPRQTPSWIQKREVRDLFHLSHCKYELSHPSRTHLSCWPPFFPSLLPDNTTTFNLLFHRWLSTFKQQALAFPQQRMLVQDIVRLLADVYSDLTVLSPQPSQESFISYDDHHFMSPWCQGSGFLHCFLCGTALISRFIRGIKLSINIRPSSPMLIKLRAPLVIRVLGLKRYDMKSQSLISVVQKTKRLTVQRAVQLAWSTDIWLKQVNNAGESLITSCRTWPRSNS